MEKNYEFLDELDLSLVQERGKWVNIFREFMKSEQKYCVISFANERERSNCRSALSALKRKNNLQITYGNYRQGVSIYIAKA